MNIYIKIVFLLFVFNTLIFADKSGPIEKLISEDLRHELKTQELILERIIKHYDKNRILSHHNVASYYIENYGALFELQRFPTSELNIFNQFGKPNNDSKTKYVWSEEKNAIVKFQSKHSKEDSLQVIKMVNDYVKDIHLAVFEFFADYMSQVTWLKENDKVCVHFDINLYRKIPKEYDRTMVENIVPLSVQVIVSKADLLEFRNNKLSIEEFDQKIKIEKQLINPQKYSYNIFGDVLVSTVKSIKEGSERPFSLYTTSIKISDLGALYFLVTQHHSDNSFNDVGSIFDFLFGRNSDNKDGNNKTDTYTKSMNELKFRLAKSVSQYGHKLKDLNDDQWIVLFVNVGRYGGFKSRFVMKISKKQIDQFENKKLSLDEFISRVEIYEEEMFSK